MRPPASTERPRSAISARLANPPRVLAAILIGLHVIIALASVTKVDFPDLVRYREIVSMHGTPYRDFPVEYPPLELVGIDGLARGSADVGTASVVLFALVCDLLAFAGMRYGFGRSAGGWYLLLALPMLGILFLGFDFLAIALAVWGAALARRDRQPAGGALVALGALARLWPVLLVIPLAARRRWRAVRWAAVTFGVGVAAWIAVGGASGPREVLTFRGASGWHLESTVGGVLWALGRPVRWELDAPRLGTVPAIVRPLLVMMLVCIVALIWRRARSWPGIAEGAPMLATLAALLALTPTFSTQYASWLVPCAAIAAAESPRHRGVTIAAIIAIVLSGAIGPTVDAGLVLAKFVIVTRDAALIACVAAWFLPANARAAQGAGQPVP